MEQKIRAESHHAIETAFNRYERRGSLPADEVPDVLKEVDPVLELDKEEVEREIHNVERRGSGRVDWPGFNKLATHFIAKQIKHDVDQFSYKHEIGPEDFSTERL